MIFAKLQPQREMLEKTNNKVQSLGNNVITHLLTGVNLFGRQVGHWPPQLLRKKILDVVSINLSTNYMHKMELCPLAF